MPKFKKENPITEEMIYKDPFNYTLKDISPILGEKKGKFVLQIDLSCKKFQTL